MSQNVTFPGLRSSEKTAFKPFPGEFSSTYKFLHTASPLPRGLWTIALLSPSLNMNFVMLTGLVWEERSDHEQS